MMQKSLLTFILMLAINASATTIDYCTDVAAIYGSSELDDQFNFAGCNTLVKAQVNNLQNTSTQSENLSLNLNL